VDVQREISLALSTGRPVTSSISRRPVVRRREGGALESLSSPGQLSHRCRFRAIDRVQLRVAVSEVRYTISDDERGQNRRSRAARKGEKRVVCRMV